jgi:hypothetical protein
MKIAELVGELEDAECYKSFMKENPDAFFCAGFLILDLENETEQIQLDYFMPREKKIAAFEFPFARVKIHDDEVKEITLQSLDIGIDVDDLGPRCRELIKENGGNIVPTKIIAVLKGGIWNLTCMDNVLGIVQIKIDAGNGDVFSFDKGSLMDFMRVKKK